MAERGGNEVAGMASASGRVSVALSFSLAALLAAAVGAAVWQLQDARFARPSLHRRGAGAGRAVRHLRLHGGAGAF